MHISIRKPLLSCALLWIFLSVLAQNNIVSYQHWFDHNFASAVSKPVSPGKSITLSENIDASALQDGLHLFHIRFLDSSGKWSKTLSEFFYKNREMLTTNKEIVSYQYWFDDNYTSTDIIPVTPGQSVSFAETIDASALNNGLHVLHIRFLDNSGQWSNTLSHFFYKNAEMLSEEKNITGYQFWFNNEYDADAIQPVTPGRNITLTGNIDASGLKNGLHVFHIRFLDSSGKWSNTASHFFYKNAEMLSEEKNITGYQYWFDNEYEADVIQPVTAGRNLSLTGNIDASGLKNGLHIFHIRFLDSSGQWSNILSQFFYKMPLHPGSEDKLITGYRYWTEEQAVNENYVELANPVRHFVLIENIDLSGIPKGDHVIHFQFRDDAGLWSVAASDRIFKESLPVAAFDATLISYCDSTVVSFSDKSIDGDIYLWEFGDGNSDTVANPVHTYYSPGTFQVTLTVKDTITGRDSTATVDLTMTGNTYKEIETEACVQMISPSGLYTWTTSGTYRDTIPNSYGCDSIITIQLEIYPSYTNTKNENICNGYPYTFPDGHTMQSIKSDYTHVSYLLSANGCDSIITTSLKVIQIDTSVTRQGSTFTATQGNAVYKWADCNNGFSLISGETSQSFRPSQNGDYALIITYNNCTDTSSCHSITNVNVIENMPEDFRVYPVPTDDKVFIETDKLYSKMLVYIHDISGRIINTMEFHNSRRIEFSLDAPPGIYYMSIISENKKSIFKLIRE